MFDEIQGDKEEKQKACDEKTSALEPSIIDIKLRLREAKAKQQPLADQIENREDQVEGKQKEIDFLITQLISLDKRRAKEQEVYEKNRDDHDALITALEECRRIIRQLVNSNFLQTNVDEKIKEHHAKNV